jgi:hypothetical protein
MERLLMTWEMKFSRKIHKPTYENGDWRKEISQELYGNLNSPDILNVIKVWKLESLGEL